MISARQHSMCADVRSDHGVDHVLCCRFCSPPTSFRLEKWEKVNPFNSQHIVHSNGTGQNSSDEPLVLSVISNGVPSTAHVMFLSSVMVCPALFMSCRCHQ